MNEEKNYQTDESYISVLKRHYMVMIILPIYFIFSWILLSALRVEHKYPNSNRIMLCIEIGLFLLFVFLPISYLFKRKYMTAFYLFLTPIIIIITTNKMLNNYGFDSEGIFFLFHREEYLHIIENSPSMATDGGAKLVKIEIPYSWSACETYVVYDESDEMSNPHGKFRGINYMYIPDMQGNKHKYEADKVLVKKYAEHTYIAHICANTSE